MNEATYFFRRKPAAIVFLSLGLLFVVAAGFGMMPGEPENFKFYWAVAFGLFMTFCLGRLIFVGDYQLPDQPGGIRPADAYGFRIIPWADIQEIRWRYSANELDPLAPLHTVDHERLHH